MYLRCKHCLSHKHVLPHLTRVYGVRCPKHPHLTYTHDHNRCDQAPTWLTDDSDPECLRLPPAKRWLPTAFSLPTAPVAAAATTAAAPAAAPGRLLLGAKWSNLFCTIASVEGAGAPPCCSCCCRAALQCSSWAESNPCAQVLTAARRWPPPMLKNLLKTSFMYSHCTPAGAAFTAAHYCTDYAAHADKVQLCHLEQGMSCGAPQSCALQID